MICITGIVIALIVGFVLGLVIGNLNIAWK